MSGYLDKGCRRAYCRDMPTKQWSVRSSADLGRAIAGARAARGLTQAELAERTGVNRSYLAALEQGASTLLLERALRALRRLGATVTVTLPDDGGHGTP
jgi:DNA-binding XRE family transcriptional regulator